MDDNAAGEGWPTQDGDGGALVRVHAGQGLGVCVECSIGKQKKPILFKVTEPSSVPYRAPPASRFSIRVSPSQCVCLCVCFITAGPITKLFAWGGEESGGHVTVMRDDEPRTVWMSLLITH